MARKTVAVEAALGQGFAVESRMGRHSVRVDQPPEMGGEDKGPTPLQYYLLSLGACVGVIARIVANQKRLALRGLTVRVQGELNTDALLGKSSESRAGFESIIMTAAVDADMTPDEKRAFLAEVKARCPVSENTVNPTPVSIELER